MFYYEYLANQQESGKSDWSWHDIVTAQTIPEQKRLAVVRRTQQTRDRRHKSVLVVSSMSLYSNKTPHDLSCFGIMQEYVNHHFLHESSPYHHHITSAIQQQQQQQDTHACIH